MGFFSVTTKMQSGNGSLVVVVMDVPDCETADDFRQILLEDGMVSGIRYRMDGRDKRMTDPKGQFLNSDAIYSATEFGDTSGFQIDPLD